MAFLVFSTLQLSALGQPVPCPPPQALLPRSDPAYSDAVGLAKTLDAHGLVVHCIFPSKLGSIFRVEEGGVVHSTTKGEAVYRTDDGDIDVVFLAVPQTFDDFRVTERRSGSGYLYSFAGTPRVWPSNKFATARRTYFIKGGNQLFIVADIKLRARLETVLNLRRTLPRVSP
jgi:hypothetical protein